MAAELLDLEPRREIVRCISLPCRAPLLEITPLRPRGRQTVVMFAQVQLDFATGEIICPVCGQRRPFGRAERALGRTRLRVLHA